MLRRLLALIVVIVVTGCASGAVREAVPPDLANSAHVAGLDAKGIRFWGDEPPPNLAEASAEIDRQRKAASRTDPKLALDRKETALVISGGGSNGAFGAGLLNGWTKSGTRPEFLVVTGVSTGALMAPFAFLGPRYDHVIKEFYTTYSTEDILRPTVLAGLFGGAAVTSSEPLANLIAKYMTTAVMRDIAREHRRGRRLLIGTTNLDAERPVIWSIGAIAAADNDRALTLIRQILLGSASIPGLFPPVMINVNVNGMMKQEMHVDGGTTDNAILLPMQTDLTQIDRRLHRKHRREMFIIVNSRLDPEWKSVKSTTLDIASRSISTLIKQQTIGDVLKLYDFSLKNRIAFRLATVPPDFNLEPKEAFDRAFMTALFKRGEELGRKGYQWLSEPPVK
jgi:predicted acylesterase/phospholipase RssA